MASNYQMFQHVLGSTGVELHARTLSLSFSWRHCFMLAHLYTNPREIGAQKLQSLARCTAKTWGLLTRCVVMPMAQAIYQTFCALKHLRDTCRILRCQRRPTCALRKCDLSSHFIPSSVSMECECERVHKASTHCQQGEPHTPPYWH